jgi:DNA-binding transcriptional LysR family regulator
MADLAEEHWLVGRDGSPFHEVMERVANEAGFDAHLDLHSNDYQVILASVEAGLGVALVPSLAFFAEYPGVVYRLPTDVTVQRYVLVAIRSGSEKRPAISAALSALETVAEDVRSIISDTRP